MQHEIELVRDRFFSAIICCTVDPATEDAFDVVDRLLHRIPSGTSNGWRTMRAEDCADMEEAAEIWNRNKPVKCADKEGRWHYVVIC